METKVKRLSSQANLPAYQTPGAAGFDLAAVESVTILPRGHALVGTGLVIETPPGHMLMLAARSSLFSKKGLILANGVGIVDEDYAGETDEVKLSLYNLGYKQTKISAGERIAQGVFVPVVRVDFSEVSEMSSPSRGGFGSTGDAA